MTTTSSIHTPQRTGRLQGKVALVTGAARGIGAAIAERFVGEGARVFVSDLDAAAARLTARRLEMPAVALDVREEMAWVAAMAQVLDVAGRLDVLVNNAGITGLEADANAPTALRRHDPEHASLVDWQAVHRTNLDGVFLGCKHGLQAMRRHPAGARGSIVNIASRSGMVGVPAAAAYASSKAAVINHTRTVALYCAEQGLAIRCNAILPGAVLTPMWEPMLGDGPDRAARMAALVDDVPLRRFGLPQEVAAVALLLASDESAYVTGAAMPVDGGLLAGSAATPKDARA